MKFLCDRCKTRYSIGDDRVRGKILKIRCKNCQNVITVREGMSDSGASDGVPPVSSARRGRTTTNAPSPHISLPDRSGNVLGAAFAQQLAKPPPALEEEWYVSIDGNQEGPFSLGEAQRWVGAKPFGAELHCWSEGFDDWLPVDKVSHFRNLRKKPMPTGAPPPLPRVAPRAPELDEPKPLFAATMASLERGAPASGLATAPTAVAPPIAPIATVIAPASAPMPKTNGAPAAMAKGTSTAAPALRQTPSPANGPQPAKAPFPGARGATTPGIAAQSAPARAAGGAAVVQIFDDSDAHDTATTIDSPVFEDEPETRAEPAAHSKRAASPFADPARTVPTMPPAGLLDASRPATTLPSLPSASLLDASRPSNAQIAPPDLDDDEANLEIGEVSRVVKLTDLAKAKKAQPQRAAPAAAQASAAPALAGQAMPDAAAESVGQAPIVARAHRRGLVILFGVAALLLAGGVGVVVLVAGDDSSDTPKGASEGRDFDTSHQDLPIVRRGATDVTAPTGSNTPPTTQRPRTGRNPRVGTPGSTIVEAPIDPSRTPRDPSEVEEMAQKQSSGPQFCFARAQRGAIGLEIQNLKKLFVTVSIDKDGAVTNVTLKEHGDDTFGRCIVARIKSWKFREAQAGGDYGFTLYFQSS